MYILNLICLTIILTNLDSIQCKAEKTLEIVHVLFRHGNRTPERRSIYPKDPYINYTYFPYGHGQLTKKGIENMRDFGKALRKRYDDFLGPVYSPRILEAISTDMNRAKISLEHALETLFPQQGADLRGQDIIPYSTVPLKEKSILTAAILHDQEYLLELKLLDQTSLGKSFIKEFDELNNYIKKHTGLMLNMYWNLILAQAHLVAQEDFGLKLPSWSEDVYPKQLNNFLCQFFNYSTSTVQLKQLSGGRFLKKLVADSLDVDSQTPKMFLYCGHDINILYLLNTMNIFVPYPPPFAAYVLIEVHKINNVRGIKILYQDYTNGEPETLRIPGCDYFCPLTEFLELMKSNIPVNDDFFKTDFKLDSAILKSDGRYQAYLHKYLMFFGWFVLICMFDF